MSAPLRLYAVPPLKPAEATPDARERRSRPGIVLWDEIARARDSVMLPLGAQVRVEGRAGRIVGRSRDWPMRYDVALDGGALLRNVEAARVAEIGR